MDLKYLKCRQNVFECLLDPKLVCIFSIEPYDLQDPIKRGVSESMIVSQIQEVQLQELKFFSFG